MGELESLWLVVAAIYLTECAAWVRRDGVAIHRGWGKRWRAWHPGGLLSNPRGSVLVPNPFPPLGSVFLAHQFPISLSSKAALSFTTACLNSGGRTPQPARYFQYEDAREISCEGRSVLVNGAIFVQASSPETARRLAVLLRELKALPEKGRADKIRRVIAETLDAENARKRWEQFQSASRRLWWLGNFLFVYLFLLSPVVIWLFGFRRAGLVVAGGLLVQTVIISRHFWRAHGTLYPGGGEERFTPFLTMLLAPPTAIRAHDLLGRRLLSGFHPLTVSEALCPAEEFHRLAQRTLVDLRYPLLPVSPSAEPAMVEVAEWFHRLQSGEIEQAAQRAGLKPGELLRPPPRAEPQNQSYCPRCGAQFIVAEGTCADCGGRPLEAFR